MNGKTHSMRRGFLAVLAVAGGISLLAGCTAATSGAPSKTTVTIMAGAGDLTKAQISDFEAKNPGITVDVIATDATRLNTMLAAGDPPDIAVGGAVGSANINARGLATDLTPYLKNSKVLKESDLQPINDSFRWNGKKSGTGPLYGIVKDWSQDNTLWYNTALFDKAGVPYLSDSEPTSYDNLLKISQQLTAKAGGVTTTYGLGLEWAWSLYGPMSAMVTEQGGHLYNSDLSKIDFNSNAAQRAFAWYVDFARAGAEETHPIVLPVQRNLLRCPVVRTDAQLRCQGHR